MNTLDPTLLAIVVCPQDRGPLLYVPDAGALYNPRLRRRYPVEDGIASLLIELAVPVDDAEHERLVAAAV